MAGLYGTGRAILILSPHPDDETLGCGGAVRLFTAAGGIAHCAFVTRGEMGFGPGEVPSVEQKYDLAATRSREAERACAILGMKQIHFLSGTDCAVGQSPQLAGEIATLLQQTPYGRVFCPWQGDNHADHLATYRWFKQALAMTNTSCDVWLYEVWQPLVPNTILPIGPVMEEKIAAIRMYESQLQVLDYLEGFVGLAKYRALRDPPSKYAEAFIVTISEDIVAGRHE